MKHIILLLVLVFQVSCSKPVDPRERFVLTEAKSQWSHSSKQWSEVELRHLEYGRHSYNSFCAACHLSSGEGQQAMGAPALKENPVVRGKVSAVAQKILFGSKRRSPMPAFARSLDDDQAAAILSYLRNAWDAQPGELVTSAEVKAVRDSAKSP